MKTNEPRTGTYALKLRWDQAGYDLQRAWDTDNRRHTEASAMRAQRAWDKAQRAKWAYEQSLGVEVGKGFYDNFEPEEV